MKRIDLVTAIGLFCLMLITYGVWRLLAHQIPPETPKATVTIPEGWRVADINEYLREEGILADGELSADLEGYLFPDTYEFFLDSSVEVVAEKFRENLDDNLIKLGLGPTREDINRIITMASLVEKEVKSSTEQRIAAGILWKRLDNGIPLQVDATICYLKHTNGSDCLPITAIDKEIDSPYNTYLYRGLPPGPIANPGLSAIEAAVKPANSPYWYYLSSPKTGETIFARTLDEQGSNIVKYLGE